jgi:hypothetical protein
MSALRDIVEGMELTPVLYFKLKKEAELTDPEIAEMFYMSTAGLSRWKVKNDIRACREPYEYKILRACGFSIKEICLKWGIKQPALYIWRKANDLLDE